MIATAMPLVGSLGSFMPIGGFSLWRYIFAAGAVMSLITRLVWPGHEEGLRRRRLERLKFWSAVTFCVAAFLIFYQPYSNDWIAFTMAGAFLQSYSSVMLARKS